jgi:predicted O-methyltransferase YrrM
MRQKIRQTLDEPERQRVSQPEPPSQGQRFSQHPGFDNMKDKMLAVGPETAKFLNTLIRATRARNVLEIGGSMGYSTVWMAEAVEVNGGRLATLEYVPEKAALLRQRIADADLGKVVEIHEGDALHILPRLSGPWDFVLVDAWKDDYPAYFDLVFQKLTTGGLMVADNITFPTPVGEGIEKYVEKARSQSNAQSQLIPLGSGLELTVRLG